MKVQRAQLLPALESACKIAAKRTTQPILNTVLLSSKNGRLEVSATDYEQRLTESVDCNGEIAPICLPASRITDAVKYSGGEIELSSDGAKLVCKSSNRFELSGLPSGEFPPARDAKKLVEIGVNSEDLATAIESVRHAVSTDASRQVLQCVYVEGNAKTVFACATDGKIGVLRTIQSIASDFSCFVPNEYLDGVIAGLKRKGSSFWLSPDAVMVRHDSGEFVCKLMEGNYPIHALRNQVLKNISEKVGEINPSELIGHTKASLVSADDMFRQVDLTFSGKSVGVKSESPKGAAYESEIVGKFAEAQFRFDQSFLIKALTPFDCDSVEILMHPQTPRSALRFKANGIETVTMSMLLK